MNKMNKHCSSEEEEEVKAEMAETGGLEERSRVTRLKSIDRGIKSKKCRGLAKKPRMFH